MQHQPAMFPGPGRFHQGPDTADVTEAQSPQVEVNVFVTHALFSAAALEDLGNSEIDRIVITDSVPVDLRNRPDNLTVLSVSGLLAEAIMNVFADDSVSAIFGGENQLF